MKQVVVKRKECGFWMKLSNEEACYREKREKILNKYSVFV